MGWFSKKTYEEAYAERLYEASAVPELGDMTPERLRLPKQTPAMPREGTVLSRSHVRLRSVVGGEQRPCACASAAGLREPP